MKKEKTIRIAITGGPGTGKSTILEILALKGYQIIPEAARIVINSEMLKKSECLPWKNLQKFQDKVSRLQLKLENSIKGKIIFSDRGIIDSYAYAKMNKLTTPKIIIDNARARYNHIFILDRLPNYKKDSVRRESLSEAKNIQNAIKSAYIEFGYKPILVPVFSPEKRVKFILNHLKNN